MVTDLGLSENQHHDPGSKTGQKCAMSGFIAQPYLLLPSGRKETRRKEKKDKKKAETHNYQRNLGSSTHSTQITETKLPLGPKLSWWLLWKLILKFPR